MSCLALNKVKIISKMFCCKSKKNKPYTKESCLFVKENELEVHTGAVTDFSGDGIIILVDNKFKFITNHHNEAEQEISELKKPESLNENPAGPLVTSCKSSIFSKSIYGVVKWLGSSDISAGLRTAMHYAIKNDMKTIILTDANSFFKDIGKEEFISIFVSTITDFLVSTKSIKVKLICSNKGRVNQYIHAFKEKFSELEILGIKVSI